MSAPQTQPSLRPSVHIGASRRVVIGRGEHRVTFQAGPVSQWTGPARRVTLEARPRQVVIGGRQGIAGPPGPPGQTGPPPAVIDGLESNSTVAALAANQGRVLDGKISLVRTDYGSHETDFANQFTTMLS